MEQKGCICAAATKCPVASQSVFRSSRVEDNKLGNNFSTWEERLKLLVWIIWLNANINSVHTLSPHRTLVEVHRVPSLPSWQMFVERWRGNRQSVTTLSPTMNECTVLVSCWSGRRRQPNLSFPVTPYCLDTNCGGYETSCHDGLFFHPHFVSMTSHPEMCGLKVGVEVAPCVSPFPTG